MSRKRIRGHSGAGRTVLACAISIAIHLAFLAALASPFPKTGRSQIVEVRLDTGKEMDTQSEATQAEGPGASKPRSQAVPPPAAGSGPLGKPESEYLVDRADRPASATPDAAPILPATERVAAAATQAPQPDRRPSTAAGPSSGTADTAPESGAASSGAGSAGLQTAIASRILAARILAEVEARKSYPESARRRGTEGTARVRLRIAPNGALEAASIETSSGSSLLDASALGLASSVFPVENPAMREFDLVIAVRYALRR